MAGQGRSECVREVPEKSDINLNADYCISFSILLQDYWLLMAIECDYGAQVAHEPCFFAFVGIPG